MKTVLDCFIKPEYVNKIKLHGSIEIEPHSCVELDKMYMGTKVQMLVEKYLDEKKLAEVDLFKIRLNVRNFFITIVNQISKRFNFNNDVLINLAIINPKNVMNKVNPSIYPLLKHFPELYDPEELQLIDDEFRGIQNITVIWNHKEIESIDGPEFWSEVLSTRRVGGEWAFPLLRRIIPILLSLSHSSVAVERIFSTYNLNKTKVRNSLSTASMKGILAAKEYVKTHQTPKGVVEVTAEAKKRFTKNMYKMNEK